jgi:hypothetical protein
MKTTTRSASGANAPLGTMKTLALLAALLAACSPPPDPDRAPDPGAAQPISRALINSDGPYAARIEFKITYTWDYDQALYGGYSTGTVSSDHASWTNRSFVGPSYSPALVCPALWVFMNKPGGATVVDVTGLTAYSRVLGRGNWADPYNGQKIEQTQSCSYKVDNVGINRAQNVDYKLWVGLDCNAGGFGGFRAGGGTSLASGIDYWSWNLTPQSPPEPGAPGPRYMINQAGPGVYGAHSLWESVTYGCNNADRRVPDGGTLPPVVICSSLYLSGICVGWTSLGNLVW